MHSASYSGSHYNAHRHMDSPLCTYFLYRYSYCIYSHAGLFACRFVDCRKNQDIRTSWSEFLRPCSLTKAAQKPASSPSLHRRVLSHRAEWYTRTEKKQGEAMGLERRWIHLTNVWQSSASHVWRAAADAARALRSFFIHMYWSNILVCKWLSSFGRRSLISTVGVISGDSSQFKH